MKKLTRIWSILGGLLGVNMIFASNPGIVMGSGAFADDDGVAIGTWTDAGIQGISVGYASNAGNEGLALGWGAYAGDWSVAIGESNASGVSSFAAMGGFATSDYSIALGLCAINSADYTTTVGPAGFADAWGSVSLGFAGPQKRRDGTTISATNPNALDPVLVVGRPQSGDIPGDQVNSAITIYRDGQVHFYGVVRVPPGGDIPMFDTTETAGINPTNIN